jgi:predicted AAA+ superfamily ATPase
MEILKRQLDLWELLSKKSFFLLGPRGTGKSTLIREQLALLRNGLGRTGPLPGFALPNLV